MVYIVAVRFRGQNRMFEFKSKFARDEFIVGLQMLSDELQGTIDWATTEVDDAKV